MIPGKMTALLLATFSTVFLVACGGGDRNETSVAINNPVRVIVAKPGENTTGTNIIASGVVEAVQTANISTRVMGYIDKIYVKVGDHVKAGQLLVSVNSNDIVAKRAQADAAISQAQAALANAKKDYDRFTALYNKQSATPKELDNVTLQYNAAKASLEATRQMRNEANAQLSYANITAPFSGVVTQKLSDAGSIANPGMPILMIEQNSSLQVSASIPESQISLLQQGSAATILVKSTGKTLRGNVIEISESSQFTGGQYLIKINIPDKDKEGLYAGMYVNVSIPVKPEVKAVAAADIVLVPHAAIVYKDQLTGLYTISNSNTALLRWVRLGSNCGNNVEVLSGLSKDENFILSADGKLYNGVPVKEK